MAYIPVTSWQAVGGDRAWLGAAVRIVIDEDTSSTSSYDLYAECTAYQYPGANETLGCLWYYNGSLITPPMYHQATWNNSTGAIGDTYLVQLGATAAGSSKTSANWRIAIDLSGGRVYSNNATASYTVPVAPSAPTSVTHTRVSDTTNTVSWTLPATTYTRMRLQRLVDGTVGAEWTFASDSGVTTYTDTGTQAGHSYTYRLRLELVPEAGESYLLTSSWVTSTATYNSPAAPTAISGARIAASTVRVTLTNTASTSTGLEVQASTDPADWSGAISQTYAGAGLATADVTGISGIYYFRARNTRGALVSDWSPISDPVVTLTAPNPPTLTAPTGAIWNYTASQSMTFSFVHNPVDGSAQTAAQVRYSTDNGSTWTTQTLTTQTSYTLSLTSSYLGKTITWQARTKGADPSYSDWSSTKQIAVYQQPTVTITLTDGNGNDVTNGSLSDMPLNYSAAITGSGIGTLNSGTFATTGYTEAATVSGTTLVGSVTPAEMQPANGTTYTVTITASMSTGLTGTGSVTVTMAFADPQAGNLATSESDGVVTCTVGLEAIGAGEVAADSISLYRVTGGVAVLIAADLADGDTVTDRYAPLNRDFSYRVVTYSAAGASRAVDFAKRITSSKWYVMSPNATAWGIWNPAGSLQFARPEKTRVQYAGRTYPVSYDGTALSDSRSSSWQLLDMDERDRFIAVMADGGRGVYKSCDGDVFMADFDLRFSANYTSQGRYGTATLTVTRIESGAL